MTHKTEQQKRFEAAFKQLMMWQPDAVLSWESGRYFSPRERLSWEVWQASEASALERAAAEAVDQSAEIERLKGLLREAADDISHWSSYAPEYFVEKYKAEDDIQKYREAGEVTK